MDPSTPRASSIVGGGDTMKGDVCVNKEDLSLRWRRVEGAFGATISQHVSDLLPI